MRINMTVYQQKPSDIYWFRKRVPTELVPAYQQYTGKKVAQVKTSLGTKDKKEAQQLGIIQLNKFKELMDFLDARAHLSDGALRKARISLWVGGLTREIKKNIDLQFIRELQELVASELKEAKALKEKSGNDAIIKPKINRKEARVVEYIRHLQNAERVLHMQERMFTDPHFDASKEAIAAIENFEDAELRMRDHLLQSLKQGGLDKSKAISASIVSNKKTITQALDTWIETRTTRKRGIGEWRHAVKRFVELHGDLPVDVIDDSHIVQFRQALIKVPVLKQHALQNKPLPELVKLAESGKLPSTEKRKPGSINKLLIAISSILEVMVNDGVISRNPAKKKLLKKDDDGSKRPPYAMQELSTLFHSDIYLTNYWSNPVQDKPSRFWVPLIALFCGFRIEEICQLRASDIRQKNNVWYISINTEYGRQYKSKAALRDVVIHEELLKIGFLRFVKEQKTESHKPLFHDLTQKSDGRLSSYFSNWYSRYAASIGIKNNNKTFHSFRDNFSDALNNAGFSDRQICELMGHASEGAKKHYGDGIWLATIARQMENMEYPELDLSHLYAASADKPASISGGRVFKIKKK